MCKEQAHVATIKSPVSGTIGAFRLCSDNRISCAPTENTVSRQGPPPMGVHTACSSFTQHIPERSTVCKDQFISNACPMAAPPLSPILLRPSLSAPTCGCVSAHASTPKKSHRQAKQHGERLCAAQYTMVDTAHSPAPTASLVWAPTQLCLRPQRLLKWDREGEEREHSVASDNGSRPAGAVRAHFHN